MAVRVKGLSGSPGATQMERESETQGHGPAEEPNPASTSVCVCHPGSCPRCFRSLPPSPQSHRLDPSLFRSSPWSQAVWWWLAASASL